MNHKNKFTFYQALFNLQFMKTGNHKIKTKFIVN